VVVLVVALGSGKTKKPSATPATTANAFLSGIPEHGLTLGDPTAPVTILEWADLRCPFCQEHELTEQPTIVKQLVATGKAQLRFMPIPILGGQSPLAHAVLLRMADQNRAWQFINLFYLNQGSETTDYVTPEFLKKLVVEAGGDPNTPLGETLTGADAKLQAQIIAAAHAAGIESTPSFSVGRTGAPLSSYKVLNIDSTPRAPKIAAAVAAEATTPG
jgi:protein-disulfide isomerase